MGSSESQELSRREFLSRAAAAAASVGVAAAARAAEGDDEIAELVKRIPTRSAPPKRSKVVIVRDKRVLSPTGRPDPEVLRAMLETGLRALSGAATAAEAWRTYFRKDDFVALKYNELGGPAIETRPELRALAVEGLTKQVGVDGEKIVPIGRCTRYKGKYAGWGPAHVIHTYGYQTRFSAVFARHATAILSMPVVKTHQSGGVTCALKLHLGSIQKPGDFCGDEDWPRLWRNLPELSSLPEVRTKQRLIVADALRPQYHKGPTNSPPHRFAYHGLLLSTDPVAIDRTALTIINDARKAKALPALTWPEKMLRLAEGLGVGLADPAKIDLVRIELPHKKGK